MSLWGDSLSFQGGADPPMPVFIDAGTADLINALDGTTTPAFPATVVQGNYLLLQVSLSDSTSPVVTTPTGWSSIGGFPSGSNVAKQYAFWKIADGTEAGTQSVSITTDVGGASRIYRFSNGSGAESAAGSRAAASSTSMPATDVTTLGSNRLAIQLFAAWTNTTIGNITGETGTDYTEAVAEYANALPVLIQIQTGQMQVVGSITGGTATLGSASTNRLSYGFAIVP
jgi:hypothetical protein